MVAPRIPELNCLGEAMRLAEMVGGGGEFAMSQAKPVMPPMSPPTTRLVHAALDRATRDAGCHGCSDKVARPLPGSNVAVVGATTHRFAVLPARSVPGGDRLPV